MKLNNFVLISFLIFSTFATDTTTTSAQQNTTSAAAAAQTDCAEGELKIKGVCVDAGKCKADLKFFKAIKRNNTGNGNDQLPNLPKFGVALDNKNLKVSLTFQNSTGLNTNLEGGSCIQVSLSRFKVAFTQEQQDLTTISTVLNADSSRVWSFIIDSTNFDTYLAKDVQTNYTAFIGFYAVNLNYTNNVNVQIASFAFRFSANLTSDLSSIINFDVVPRPRGSPVCADTAETQCVQQAASTIVCCGTDSTCQTTVTNTTLVVDQTYYFFQSVTQDGFNNGKWRPQDANITVQADGVTKMVKPKIVSQNSTGTIYEVKFKFLANNVTIASDATLGQVSSRRLLQTTTDTNASAVASTSSSCITTSASTCPTSDQVTTYNSANCAGTSCDDDASSNAIVLVMAIMSLLI